MEKKLSEIVFLSFVDDLSFIASKTSVKEIAKALKKVSNLIVEFEERNAVTYNTAKTKLILFSHIRQQCLNQQLQKTTVLIEKKNIKFNKDIMRWLGIWLNSQLRFIAYVNKR